MSSGIRLHQRYHIELRKGVVTVNGSLYWLTKRGLFHHALQFRRVDIDTFWIVENEKDLLKRVRRCLTEIF